MDLFKHQLEAQSSGVFVEENEDHLSAKVTTEIFDSTLPSELEFDDVSSPHSSSSNPKDNLGPILDGLTLSSEHEQKSEEKELGEQRGEKEERRRRLSEYQTLTKSIVNFSFRKVDQGVILRQKEHQVGSFIPYELGVKTFEVKFYDEQSELSKGVPAYKLLWKSVVGYAKVELYIKNGYVYLLEARKEGLYLHAIWDLQHLFKVFSDRDESKVRLIFRITENTETKLVAKELVSSDLNLLAHIFEEAKDLEIVCDG
jgi:hypothetical protein